MVESLVDIAYRHLKRREEYENKNGSGSYCREVLEPFLGKHVTLQGLVAAITVDSGVYRVTLRNVIVKGRNLDHINFTAKEDSKILRKATFALRSQSVIKVGAFVRMYRSGFRRAYGLSDARFIELVKCSKKEFVNSEVKRYFNELGYDETLKWQDFTLKGFEPYDFRKLSELKNSYYGYLERLLSCSLRCVFSRNTFGEVAVAKQCKEKTPFTRARVIQESLKKKGNSEYLCFLQYKRTIEEHEMGVSASNLHNFSKCQSRRYVVRLKTLGHWVIISTNNEIFHYSTGGPLVLKMRNRDSFTIIYPSLSEKVSYLNNMENLKKLLEDFKIPSGAQVSVYNPILNRIAEIDSEVILNG